MKDSSLKNTALSLLLTVFVAVVVTSRWADSTPNSHCKRPSEGSTDISSQLGSPPQQQTSRLNTQADAGEPESEIAIAAALADRRGERERKNRAAQRQLDRLNEVPDDGGEPADNAKATYGDDDVE